MNKHFITYVFANHIMKRMQYKVMFKEDFNKFEFNLFFLDQLLNQS